MTPSSKTNFLLFLVALLFISTLYLLYLNFFPKPKVSTLPTDISPTSTQVSTVTWKTYTNQNGAVISYPPSWTVVNANQGFSLTQGNYQISMDFPANFGPGTCIFSDDPNFNNPFTDNEMLAGSKCPGMFTETKAGQLIFRRINSPDANPVDTSHNQWTVYTKKNDGFFVTNPLITFKAPLDFNTNTLLEMDQILSTFKLSSPPVTTKTVELKTLSNDKYGYSFKYPSGAKVYGDTKGTAFSLIQNNKAVTIIIGSNPNNDTLQNYFLKQINSQDPQSISKYVNFTDFTIGTNKFVLAIQDPTYFKNQSTALNNYLIATNKGSVISINTADFSSREANESLINQILASFKIL